MTSARNFPLAVVLTATSGIMMPGVRVVDLLALVAYLLGREVWVHELASKLFVRGIRGALLTQYPELARVVTFLADVSVTEEEAEHMYSWAATFCPSALTVRPLFMTVRPGFQWGGGVQA